jgi:predicted DNA-binding protein (UPF0251 family)
MPRPPIERFVAGVPRVTLFKPAGVPARGLEQLRLAVDEFEAIRLVDLEGLSHEQAAEALGVSRQTVGRVLERGRAKVAEALVGGKAILIAGGKYRVAAQEWRCLACDGHWLHEAEGQATHCPTCGSSDITPCWRPGAGCRREGRGMGAGRGRGEGRGMGAGGGRGTGGGRGQGPRGHGAGRDDRAAGTGNTSTTQRERASDD